MKNKLIVILNFILIAILLSSCKKLVEVDGPTTSVNSKNVYNNNGTAIGAVSSLYVNMVYGSSIATPGNLISLSCIAGLSGDELDYYEPAGNTSLEAYYHNNLNNSNVGGTSDYWSVSYSRIYTINAALEGLSVSSGLSLAVKQQLLGETKFMRAFYYFYLVNLYGDIPLVLSTDYTINALITKSPKSSVYLQIIEDLIEAQKLLNDKYLTGDAMTPYSSGSEERLRPTKWAAAALLARVYLFTKDWINAEKEATSVIDNESLFQLQPLEQVFLKNSREAIWQLQPIGFGENAPDANTFVIPAEGPSFANPVSLSEDLFKRFAPNDKRRIKWIGHVEANGTTYYFPNKYKVVRSSDQTAPVVEYATVMRLSEQYLIRAESRAHLGNLDGAVSDVDKIRQRAGLNQINSINLEDLNKVISEENRLEMFTEWGHRWLDLKRTEEIDERMNVVTPLKGNTSGWRNYQQFYPISVEELRSNPNLVQVQGY